MQADWSKPVVLPFKMAAHYDDPKWLVLYTLFVDWHCGFLSSVNQSTQFQHLPSEAFAWFDPNQVMPADKNRIGAHVALV